MSREQVVEMARENLGYVKAGATQLQRDVLRVPASSYFDRERWQLEIERIFMRMPLMLARQQRALVAGGRKEVLFGRNEGGGQRFHRWLDRLLAADDDGINQALRAGDPLAHQARRP